VSGAIGTGSAETADSTQKRPQVPWSATVIAAHRQLPGGVIVLVWDNLDVHLRAEPRAFTGARSSISRGI
jgi:hypothetical protein